MYNSYFKWKKHIVLDKEPKSDSFLCDICIKMHLDTFYESKNKIIYDLGNIWNRQRDCVHPNDISRVIFNSEL